MMRAVKILARISFVIVGLLLAPAAVYAQGSIVGLVKDPSGAVLPGVTVEAASPALIEKTRTAVSDGTGQYRIVDLRPGIYSVTFSLTGFNTVKREGIELTGSFAASVNAEMKVGAVEETITVTGESPIVDVQSATKERVMNHEIIDNIPQGRTLAAMGVLIPGVTLVSGTQDVGGATSVPLFNTMGVHGSKQDSQRLMQNGISLASLVATGYASSAQPNMAAMQEIAIDYSAVSAEQATGGINVNFIPRDGGNTFKGTVFAGFANNSMQASNFTDDLKNRGLTTPDALKKSWDVNPGVGGPLRKDRLWFYGAIRYTGAYNYVAGMFYNLNYNNPNVWTYAPDTSRPASNDSTWKDATLRLTWQANPKNKIGFSWDQQDICLCLNLAASLPVASIVTPDAARKWYFPVQRQLFLDWTSPVTNKLLFEAAATQRFERFIMGRPLDLNPAMIAVVDQSSGVMYRARDVYANSKAVPFFYRAAVSYITGAHAIKVGFVDGFGQIENYNFDNQPVTYRLLNGVPNLLYERAWPQTVKTRADHDLGVYAQDKWTAGHLTASYGLRFDYYKSSFPEQTLTSSILAPGRTLTFPAQDDVSWKDVTPKLGASYDVFGTGKTAIKATLNKYLAGQGTGGLVIASNPVNLIVLNTNRAWTDANRDYVPQCDLLNPAANGECGPMASSAFGTTRTNLSFDPDLMQGWGKRLYNWEFSMGVQHELVPRASVDVSYFRRWYGNFFLTDNRAAAPSDYTQYGPTAPVDARLPNGGGYTVAGVYDLNPNKVGQVDNFVTLADNYGKQIEHWNFIDVTVNVRPGAGLLIQGGSSTGHTTTDICEVAPKVPEILFGLPTSGLPVANLASGAVGGSWTPLQFCHQDSPWLTQLKLLGSYTVPKIDVQFSGTFQSLPGPIVQANYAAPNAVVAPVLGRSLSGSAANTTFNVIAPGSQYGDRLYQFDLRFAKLLRFRTTRTAVNLDLYNVLNANPVLSENVNFGAFRRPTSILTARLFKISAQIDF